ncbi:DinB family protein [Chryseomicrobium sp. FSL W7-1435]|uniref:DinB family protein n=1 Tax=Chryseomicrobium sp. FSL W7-1435 TaxID=2921704 RepID=UPI00315A60E6
MEPYLASHLDTVRSLTVKVLDTTPEELLDVVPPGYSNSIRWNLGHIVYVQERLAYEVAGKDIHLPDQYARLFAAGTKPADWNETPPSIEEIRQQLVDQSARIKASHQSDLNTPLSHPFTNKSGITFDTVGGCLLFSCFHEGLHLDTIRHYLRQLKK